MLYNAYEVQRSLLAGASAMANFGSEWLQNPANPLAYAGFSPLVASGLDVFAHAAAPRVKPAFGFTHTLVDGRKVAVRSVYQQSRVDAKRLKADHPDAYAACRVTSPVDKITPSRAKKETS